MKSKAFILVALLCALFLLVSSTMAADTPKDETKGDKAKEPEQYGGRCRYGCCGWGRNGCQRCCKTADEAAATGKVNVDTETKDEAMEPEQYGGRCRYGCCGWGRNGCQRCCRTADEAAGEVNVDINRQGGSGGGFGGGGRGGGGGHCRFGCCGGGGRYCRCCYNPEEAYMQNEN